MISPRLQPRGFTLLELVLVMVVVAVLAVATVPRLAASMARGRLDDQCLAIVSLSRRAKALAATEGRSYVLVIDPVESELRLRRKRDPLAEATDEEDPELEAVANAFWAEPIKFRDDVTLVEASRGGEGDTEEETLDVTADVRVEFRQNGTAEKARFVFQGKDKDQLVVSIDPHLGVARILTLEGEAERLGVTE